MADSFHCLAWAEREGRGLKISRQVESEVNQTLGLDIHLKVLRNSVENIIFQCIFKLIYILTDMLMLKAFFVQLLFSCFFNENIYCEKKKIV